MRHIKYEKRGLIGIITIDKQEVLNALDGELIDELGKTLDTISPDDTRCVIITGGGKKAFVAGADIASMQKLTKEEAAAWSRRGNEVLRKVERLCIPVIAAVNGYALGGGCELALSCDIRIASENAVFAQPETSLGVIAGFGGTQRLPRLVGSGRAKEMLFAGTRIDAVEAYRIGLVNKVYPLDTLMDEACKLADKIAANAPIGVRAAKKAVNHATEASIDEGLETEAVLFGNCFETTDQLNAMSAFLDKKKPEPFVNK
jgi:enoyl-CoA hydratase